MSVEQERVARSGRWNLLTAFAIGGLLGACIGLLVGWFNYGAFELGRFSGYVLAGLFIGGFGFVAVAALRNWLRRNPL